MSCSIATYFGDLNLDGGVVLGGDESVGGGALAGDVKINNSSFVVLHIFILFSE